MPIFWKKILSSEQKIKWKLRKFFNEKNNDEFFSMLRISESLNPSEFVIILYFLN